MGIEVPVEFIAVFDKALNGLESFTKETGQQLDNLNKKFNIFGSISSFDHFLEVGKKLKEVLVEIGHAFLEVINEAAGAEATINQLNQSLKASGDFSEQNVRAFQDLAEQLSKTSRFDDDLILSQVRLAKQFNTTNKEAAKLITAAVDLSAATGDDLSTSVRNLGQTLDGTVGRVGQLIPSLQGLTAEQLRSGAAIDVVAKRFKGFAESELKTFEGSVGEVKKSFLDLIKAIGAPVVQNEALIKTFNAITQSFRDLGQFAKDNKQAISDFVTSGVIIAVESFGVLIQITDIVIRQFSIMIAQTEALTTGFIGLWQVLQTRLSVGFTTLVDTAKKYSERMAEIGKRSEVFNVATQAVADLSVKLEEIQKNAKKTSEATKDVAEGFDGLSNSSKRFDTSIIEKIKALGDALQDIGEDSLQGIQNKFEREFDLIQTAGNLRLINSQKIADLERRLFLKNNQEVFKDLQGKVQEIFNNPFSQLNKNPKAGGSLGVGTGAQQGIASGLGIANNVLQGGAGATALLSSLAGSIGTALLGPVGQLLGPIAAQLAKGPDAIRQMVADFAAALPQVVANLIKAAPAFVIELVKQIPNIIQGFVDELPDVIIALVDAIPDLIAAFIEGIPRIIEALVVRLPGAIVRALGGIFTNLAESFVGKVLEGAANFVGQIIEGAGKFVEELVKKLSGGVGSKGGLFGTGLFNFQGGGQGLLGGSIIPGVLAQVIKDVSRGVATSDAPNVRRSVGPQFIEVPVSVGHAQFARAIIDVKRLGYRLEPI